jgi:tetratricopeptide (TPR) repeat protein
MTTRPLHRCLSFLLGCHLCVTTLALPAAGPSREEVKTWTRHYETGTAAAKKGELGEAFGHFAAALQIARDFGPKDVRLADNLTICGRLLLNAKAFGQAERLLREAAAMREAIRGNSHRETAWAWLEHADALIGLGKYAESETLIQQAKRNLEKAFGPYHSSLGLCLAAQARIKARQQQVAEAEELYKSAVRFLSRTDTIIRSGIDSTEFLNFQMNRMVVAHTHVELAELYTSAGRHADAVAAYREAVKLAESKQGRQSPAIPAILVQLAKAQIQQKDFAAAGATVERAVQVAGKVFGPEHPAIAIVQFTKVHLLMAQENWSEAEVEGIGAMANAGVKLPGGSKEWIPMLQAMTVIREKLGKAEEAKEHRARIEQINRFHNERFRVP